MTPAEREAIAAAVRRAANAAEMPWPLPEPGPVPLRDLIAAFNLDHDAVPDLSYVGVAKYLQRFGVEPPADFWQNEAPLAGFLYANAGAGFILVNAGDSLPRRRFSAAHELGHYLLHYQPGDNAAGFIQGDELGTIAEEDAGETLAAMERQANVFAAELLMPAEVCERIARESESRHGRSPRYIEHRIAGDLLVSREAARWRMRALANRAA